jgi:hypothetical protein
MDAPQVIGTSTSDGEMIEALRRWTSEQLLLFAARLGVSQVERLLRHCPVPLRHFAIEISQKRRFRVLGQILVLAHQCPVAFSFFGMVYHWRWNAA